MLRGPLLTVPDGTGLRAEDIDGAVASLEARLGRSLTFGEQCRLMLECIEKARSAGELRECADRLYEEFSKRVIQPSQRVSQARPARLPRGIVDARGLMIPFAGHRRRASSPTSGYPYMLAGCDKLGKVFVYRFPTEYEMLDTLSELEGLKILYHGLAGTEEGERWKSMEGQFSDECPREEEYGEGYV